MRFSQVLRRKPVRRVWLAGLVFIALLALDLLLGISNLLRTPRDATALFAGQVASVALTAAICIVLLGAILYGLWYVYTQQFAVQAAVANERSRIARDLHDSLGFQLVNALAQLDNQPDTLLRMRIAIEQALIELHTAVDSLDPGSRGLVERMACLRYRIQPSLDRQGIAMDWRVSDSLDQDLLPVESAAHVLKIAQEALGNVLRHAQASRVEVLLEPLPEQPGLLLQISDNGRGMGALKDLRVGHGMVSMRRRAQLLGGLLQVTSEPGHPGTSVRLKVLRQGLPDRRSKPRTAPGQ